MDKNQTTVVAECLEDYHRRRALGEDPVADDYRATAGDSYADFLKALEAETVADHGRSADAAVTFPTLFGDYTLLKELGRGAMGVVYEAVDRRLGRKVALKVLRTGFDTASLAFERFRREARACAAVRHTNIVEIYESGEVDGRPFYAMALCSGRPLSRMIRHGRLDGSPEVYRGLAGVADALQALHDAGIVHRDVKPSNIMVEDGGRMILADFGLARTAATGDLTQTGEALGTPLYMSPEQALGKRTEVDGRTDVYGLGATIYEAFSGKPVFSADDTGGMLRMILSEKPRNIREHVPDIAKGTESVVMTAVEKRREDRYETAAAMKDDLLALAAGEPVVGRPVPTVVHWMRRWRVHAIAAVALVFLLAWLGVSYAGRPATLEIRSFPAAEVYVDGEPWGATPVVREVDAGEHEIELKLTGFSDRRESIALEAGDDKSIERVMIAVDPDDPDVLGALAHGLALRRVELSAPTGLFAMAVPDGLATAEHVVGAMTKAEPVEVQAVFPRGKVRLEDLDWMRLDFGPDAAPSGRLEIRKGNQLLFSKEILAKEGAQTRVAFPTDVVEGLSPGDSLTWGFYPDHGESVTAQCDVVLDSELAQKIARLTHRLKENDPRVASHLRAELFLSEGLNYAAFREAMRVAKKTGDSARAWALLRQALSAMNLQDSAPWQTAHHNLRKFSEERLRRAFEQPPQTTVGDGPPHPRREKRAGD